MIGLIFETRSNATGVLAEKTPIVIKIFPETSILPEEVAPALAVAPLAISFITFEVNIFLSLVLLLLSIFVILNIFYNKNYPDKVLESQGIVKKEQAILLHVPKKYVTVKSPLAIESDSHRVTVDSEVSLMSRKEVEICTTSQVAEFIKTLPDTEYVTFYYETSSFLNKWELVTTPDVKYTYADKVNVLSKVFVGDELVHDFKASDFWSYQNKRCTPNLKKHVIENSSHTPRWVKESLVHTN